VSADAGVVRWWWAVAATVEFRECAVLCSFVGMRSGWFLTHMLCVPLASLRFLPAYRRAAY
jgi:hypothetical protein